MKNIKRKIFQIILTVFMVFSSCFLTGTVEAVDDTGSATSNNLYVASNDIIDGDVENNNTNNIPQNFISAGDGEGSDITDNDPLKSTEGGIYTDKVITKVDENGTYKITLYAKGYKYRDVDDNNQKDENIWLNPMADGSQLIVKENIDGNFEYVKDSIKVIKYHGLSNAKPFKVGTQDVSLVFAKTDVDDRYTNDEHVAFDVEIEFQVTLKSFAEGTYNTSTAESYYKPAKDNFHYYEWGFETSEEMFYQDVNWNGSKSDFETINNISIINLLDRDGNLIKTNGTGQNPTPNKLEQELTINRFSDEKLWFQGLSLDFESTNKEILEVIMWFNREDKNSPAYLKFQVKYSDGTSTWYEPENPIDNPEGHDKTTKFILGIITNKTDSNLREDFTLTDGLIKDVLDNHGQIVIDSIDSTNILQNKTAHVIDWDDRTYQIDLYAAHNIDINTDPINIAIMLDFSGSMPWFVEQPGTSTTLSKINTNENQVSEVIDKGNEEGTGLGAWDYKYYIKEQGEGSSYEYKPIAYNKYDMEKEIGGKVRKYAADTWYPIKSYSGGQKILDEENPLEDNKTIYIREGSSQTKLEALKDSLEYFITNLKSVSPGSKVAIIPFAGGILSGGTDEFVDVDSINVGSIFNNITLHGYTNQKAAMDEATRLIDGTNLPKEDTYALLFSDGDFSTSFTWKGDKINLGVGDLNNSADSLKEKVQLLFTAGIFAESTEKPSGVTHMESWASDDPDADGKKCVYIENTATDLIDAFADIFGKITFQINNVTIKDYIDNRFQLYNNITGKELKVGDTFAGGTICEDNKGIYIQWDNVSLSYGQDGSYSWHRTIFVKAKDEYIGGNNVATNGDGSGIDVGNVHVDFGKPEVNVKVDFVVGNHDKTVFLGESVNLEDAESKLFDVNDLYNSKGDRLTMDSDGKTLDETDFDLSWYSEIDEHMQNVIMDSEVNAKTPIYPTEDDQVYYLVAKLKEETSETGALNNTNQNTNTDEDTLLAKNDMDTIPNPNDFTLVDHVISNYANKNSKYGVYIVNAVSGSITINKNIEGNLINSQTQGDTVFTFSVVGETLDGEEFLREYKVLKFENEDPQSFTINGLQKGKYTITELKSIRYNLFDLSYDPDTTCPTEAVNKDAKQVVFYIGCDDDRSSTNMHATHGEATYTNEVVNDENYSDASFVKNTFTVDANGKVTISGQTTTDVDSQNNE